ncbi:MAG: tetratricopeptide repeat protein [Candidatus Zipacnadales bacterium]
MALITPYWRYCVLSVLVVFASLTGGVAQAAVGWLISTDGRESWRVALDRAQRTRQPIMAFACIETQQLSVLMETQTFEQVDVSKKLREFLCVRVDAIKPANRPFLQQYGVGKGVVRIEDPRAGSPQARELQIEEAKASTYPVTMFISPDGELEHLVYGFTPPQEFLHILDCVKEVMDIREGLRKNQDDAKAIARLGTLYVELQRYPAGKAMLQKALALDKDGQLGIGETALLDLAIVHMAAGEYKEAIECISQHRRDYPTGESHCKAQFLLGGALLASVEEDRIQAEELEAAGDAQGAAAARARLSEGRRLAAEAWSWFLVPPGGEPPCKGSQWAEYSLGALQELQAEIDYEAVHLEVARLLKEGKTDAACDALRQFVKTHPDTDRVCDALFEIGTVLLKAGKRTEALAHWRKMTVDDPSQNPCKSASWRAEALNAIEENEGP